MATFYVGQRVRLVWVRQSAWGAWAAGAEGRILSPQSCEPVAHDWVVELRDGTYGFALTDQLEPILPEGAAPSEFTTLADLLTSLDAKVPA